MTAIGLDGLTVELGGRAVVDDVSASVERGEWVALIGPNGAGKTTLLRAIAGLLRHDGRVSLLGTDAEALDRRERARILAVVPQTPETPPWLTVAEYVLMGRTPHLGPLAREGAADRDAAWHALERLELEELAERTLGTLSGGERQRVGIARALCRNASILLLDEATSALDSVTGQRVMERLMEERRSGRTMLIIAHRVSTLKDSDTVVVFDQGRLVEQGSFNELADDPESQFGRMCAVQTVSAVIELRNENCLVNND